MTKKKALITVLAFGLVCALAISGTLAFLSESSGSVQNTFVAAGGGKIIDDDPTTSETEGTFTINEVPVQQGDDGTYTTVSGAERTNSGLSFQILPGLDLPKEAYIDITGKTTVPAYLYVEIVNNLSSGIYEDVTADTNNWIAVMDGATQKTGANGGKLYVYAPTGTAQIIKATDAEGYKNYSKIQILAGNKVTVKSDVTESQLAAITNDSLSFYAYLGQASAGTDALSAYVACFE